MSSDKSCSRAAGNEFILPTPEGNRTTPQAVLIWRWGSGFSSDPKNWRLLPWSEVLWLLWTRCCRDVPSKQFSQWRLDLFETRRSQLLDAIEGGYVVGWPGMLAKRAEEFES